MSAPACGWCAGTGGPSNHNDGPACTSCAGTGIAACGACLGTGAVGYYRGNPPCRPCHGTGRATGARARLDPCDDCLREPCECRPTWRIIDAELALDAAEENSAARVAAARQLAGLFR